MVMLRGVACGAEGGETAAAVQGRWAMPVVPDSTASVCTGGSSIAYAPATGVGVDLDVDVVVGVSVVVDAGIDFDL